MIEVKNLKKKYGSFEAVKGVDFEIGKGEIVGLLGPNGAGKTTIMKMLTGYMFPTSGTAVLNDLDVVEHPLEVKTAIGYLPENTPLYNDLSVYDYLSFIAEAHGLDKKKKEERLAAVTKECGLEKVLFRPISEISKGYKQRVGLAQALIHDPAILILDEPTSGLDPNQIIEIRDLIKRLGREKTVILSTHILQEVEAICGRVLILNEGFIVAKGTAAEIAKELRGQDVLIVTLKGADPNALSADLGACAVIDRVMSAETQGGDRVILRASVKPGATGADEAVFDWAVGTGNKVLSIAPQRLSLEEIFTKLTREGTSNDQ
ncbi:MAG: ATP-binding cassette domain-containing protein [Spirochaetales bacterium]|nr:ATP-binding cassette domain-containing protein [Spirochaetales bacterium]